MRRKALDEQLASEPHLPHPVIPPGEPPRPLEGIFAIAIPWPSSGWWRTAWCACSTRE